jgi:hypothetical protein
MSNVVNEFLGSCRPPVFTGRGDKYLAGHAQELRRLIAKAAHRHPELRRLGDRASAQLGVCLAEMAEDLHNDIGIWRAVEQANQERRQTPLPFLMAPGDTPPAGFDARRFQYYLYVILRHGLYQPGLKPRAAALQSLAETVSRYCVEKFSLMPAESGVKRLLEFAQGDYLVIKEVLAWFGTNSYLLRPLFDMVVAGLRENRSALTAQYCRNVHTVWLGFKPLELLARVLPLSDADRQDLLGWGKPAPCGGELVAVRNIGKDEYEATLRSLLSGREYGGRAYAKEDVLVTGRLGRGNLVAWRGQRYWDLFFHEPHQRDYSGGQLAALRRNDAVSAGDGVFALCPELAAPARARLAEFHQQFLARHGGEWAVVRTGREAAEIWLDQQRAIAPAGDAPTLAEAAMILPHQFLEAQDGVGVFSDPAHGLSFNDRFDALLAALKKPAGPWTDAESRALTNAVVDYKINPAFTRKLAAEHGQQAFLARFDLAEEPEQLAFDWLLDAYRGPYRAPDYLPFVCVIPAVQG